MGCGNGKDLSWWATLEAEDDTETFIPLNINCTGIDLNSKLVLEEDYENVEYISADFEALDIEKKFDIIWCHDSFQYSLSPLTTLQKWNKLLNQDALLMMSIPQTTNIN